jgi:hypothetical protein
MLTFNYDTSYEPAMPVATVTLLHPDKSNLQTECTALIDSGADGTMMPLALLDQFNAPLIGDGHMRGIFGIGELVDIYLVRLQIGSHFTGGVRVVATSNELEPIIGRDVINHFVVTLNGLANTVEIIS